MPTVHDTGRCLGCDVAGAGELRADRGLEDEARDSTTRRPMVVLVCFEAAGAPSRLFF